MMTNPLSTEIGRLRATEMVTRGRRYLEVNRPASSPASDPVAPSRTRAPRKVVALAAGAAAVLPALSLVI